MEVYLWSAGKQMLGPLEHCWSVTARSAQWGLQGRAAPLLQAGCPKHLAPHHLRARLRSPTALVLLCESFTGTSGLAAQLLAARSMTDAVRIETQWGTAQACWEVMVPCSIGQRTRQCR